MATYYFSGKAKWASDIMKVDKYGKHSMKLIVDEKTAKEFQAIGAKTTPKPQDDGTFAINLTRKPTMSVWKNGKKTEAGPPEVIDASGKPFEGAIGNDSDVTVKVEVFKYDNSYGKGIGVRLDKVRVDNLVEYKPGGGEVRGNVGEDFQPF